jgi:ribosomal-protein-alanine N-acetyltransferase
MLNGGLPGMTGPPDKNIKLRDARESDRQRLRDLTIEGFDGVSIDHAIDHVLGPISDADWRDRKAKHIDEDLDSDSGLVIVAENDEQVVGYVSLRFDYQSKVGCIPNLAVTSTSRGQGLGRILLNEALERFREAGMTVARIETLEHNPIGRHLYPSVGFVEVARQVHYAIDLRKPL